MQASRLINECIWDSVFVAYSTSDCNKSSIHLTFKSESTFSSTPPRGFSDSTYSPCNYFILSAWTHSRGWCMESGMYLLFEDFDKRISIEPIDPITHSVHVKKQLFRIIGLCVSYYKYPPWKKWVYGNWLLNIVLSLYGCQPAYLSLHCLRNWEEEEKGRDGWEGSS